MNEKFAATLLDALAVAATERVAGFGAGPGCRARLPSKKRCSTRLSKIVDARAAELQVSAEVLAPRGELKALAMGRRDPHALTGGGCRKSAPGCWRLIGESSQPAAAISLGALGTP